MTTAWPAAWLIDGRQALSDRHGEINTLRQLFRCFLALAVTVNQATASVGSSHSDAKCSIVHIPPLQGAYARLAVLLHTRSDRKTSGAPVANASRPRPTTSGRHGARVRLSWRRRCNAALPEADSRRDDKLHQQGKGRHVRQPGFSQAEQSGNPADRHQECQDADFDGP